MTFGSIVVLALGLGLDTAAVSAVRGAQSARPALRQALGAALVYGAFHVVMPVLGWYLGRGIQPIVEAWDHWLAFALLTAVGGKMLFEARSGAGAAGARPDAYSSRVLFALAFATSIDAFAVGIMLPLMEAPIGLAAATIGAVAASLSLVGYEVGRRFGPLFGPRFDALGGIVLVALGTRILVEHLTAA